VTAPRAHTLRQIRHLQFWLRLLSRLLPDERRIPLFWAALIGFLGAGAALAFQAGSAALQYLFTFGHIGGQVATFRLLSPLQRLAIPALGGAAAGVVLLLARRLARRPTTDYMEAIALGEGEVPVRTSLARSAAALFSIASGAAIGREGPLVQLAALAGSIAARLRRMAPARVRLLVACGAAAGIAAAYNAPIAGALFVAEIVLGSIAMESLGPLLIASVASVLTMRSVAGDGPLYSLSAIHAFHAWELLLFALLGVVCAAGAHLLLKILRASRWLFDRLAGPLPLKLGLGGLAVGLAALWNPAVPGNGRSMLQEMRGGTLGPAAVAVLLGLKLGVVALVFGSGAVGGVFTPILFGGAAIGFLFSNAAAVLLPGALLECTTYAAVGMGAFLAAATQAPVMAIFMVFEMSLQHQVLLPSMVAAVAAYVAARSLGAAPIYAEALRAGPRSVFDRPLGQVCAGEMMRTRPATVEPGAKFREVALRFLRAPARELFVVDRSGRFVGAILLPDVRPYLRDPYLAEVVSAIDILREDIPTIDSGLGLPEALALFSRCSHESLPVVAGPDGTLAGTILRSDLFRTVSELARRE